MEEKSPKKLTMHVHTPRFLREHFAPRPKTVKVQALQPREGEINNNIIMNNLFKCWGFGIVDSMGSQINRTGLWTHDRR